jgi:hypothetical protein
MRRDAGGKIHLIVTPMKKKNTKIVRNNSFTEFLLYTTPNGNVKVEIFLRDENIWLTQERIAVLFGVQRPAITKHLRNIFESGELSEISVSSILEHTADDGKAYQISENSWPYLIIKTKI